MSNTVQANGSGVILDSQLNAYVQTDQTAAQLRGFIGATGMAVMLQGLSAPGDGGAGLFYWANGASYTDDGANTIVPYGAVGSGAWLRSTPTYAVPVYAAASLPAVTTVNQGNVAYVTNGRNTGEATGAGTGCLATVNKNGIWVAVWSGTVVTS